MKTTLLKKTPLFIAFFAAITMSAQQGPTLYDFNGGAQGWAKGYDAGLVAHDASEGATADGALTLDRVQTNNNANIRRGQGGDPNFIVLDRGLYNAIKIVYKNELAATSFRIQGQSRAPGGTSATFTPIVVNSLVNGVSQASSQFTEVIIDITSIPAGHEVTRLDILVRENATADAAGALMVFDSIEFTGPTPPATSGPNIILILTDDMGYADVGFNNGAGDIATPNIDALANAGTKFTSAYVTHPFCGPSRAGLMTGRYPHEFGAQFNLSDTNTNDGVDLNETFFSTVIDDAGYNTGIIGKWHLGQPTGYRPNQRGFDYFYGMLYGGHVYVTGGGGGSAAYTSPLRENEGLAGEANGLYVTDLFSDKGVEFIDDSETLDSQPFFLFMSYNAPHTPLQPLASDVTTLANPPYNFTYPNTTEGNKRKNYAAMVYSVDRGVKKLVDALVANGEFDNTLIVFLSDNGGRTDQGALNTPLRGVKGDTYEGGFRVPMFMHWPNGGAGVPAGQVYDHNVSSLDLYPTFVNLASGTIPGGKEIDGKDIMNDVINNTDARAGESIYAIRHQAINKIGIRRGNYKAYRDTGNSNNNPWRLFDVRIGQNEEENFSQALDVSTNPYKDILTAMLTDAYQWSTTHAEPLFFDSSGAESTWISTNSTTTTTWQERAFEGYTTALSIDDIRMNDKVYGYIYPNPVQSSLSVKFNTQVPSAIDMTVYDIQGRPIQINSNLKTDSSNSITLPLDTVLSKGTYILRVTSELGTFSKTFIKN